VTTALPEAYATSLSTQAVVLEATATGRRGARRDERNNRQPIRHYPSWHPFPNSHCSNGWLEERPRRMNREYEKASGTSQPRPTRETSPSHKLDLYAIARYAGSGPAERHILPQHPRCVYSEASPMRKCRVWAGGGVTPPRTDGDITMPHTPRSRPHTENVRAPHTRRLDVQPTHDQRSGISAHSHIQRRAGASQTRRPPRHHARHIRAGVRAATQEIHAGHGGGLHRSTRCTFDQTESSRCRRLSSYTSSPELSPSSTPSSSSTSCSASAPSPRRSTCGATPRGRSR
jgi:hypothetical protein